MLSNTGSFFDNFQNLANFIKSDVERQLNREFKHFDVLEHEALNDPEHTSYFMKVKTDDNGHVKVKTTRHPAGGEWKTDIQEYDRGNALENNENKSLPLENQNQQFSQGNEVSNLDNQFNKEFNKPLGSDLSTFGSNLLFDHGFQSWQNLADRIKNDVESQLNTNFDRFDVLEHEAKKDPEHTSFFMKVKTDDNGHVKVKTTRHEAGGDWKTDVQEYDRGNALQGRSDRNMPIENKGQQSNFGNVQTANP